jgi:UDPglucose 6-dehydrogenase
MEQARALLDNVVFATDAYDCATGADAVVLVTEWDAYRALDLDALKQRVTAPVLIDLRNVYRPEELRRHSFRYVGVGRSAGNNAGC